MEDFILLLRASKGDTDALELIIKKYYDNIFHFIRKKTSNIELAQDLTQDVFIQLTLSIKKNPIKVNFKAYLFTIARHVLSDYYRKSVIECISLEHENISYESKNVDFRLKELLQQLDQIEKKILQLHYYEGYTLKEIGLILNMKEYR